jgi:hypothetical protein
LAKKKPQDITPAGGRSTIAVQRALEKRGRDGRPEESAAPTATKHDSRLLCAWTWLDEELEDETGFARWFGLYEGQEIDGAIMRNALVEARSHGGFIVEVHIVTMPDGEGGELNRELTIIVPKNRHGAIAPFVDQLRQTKLSNLMVRWFPGDDDGAAAWMRYEVGGVIAWTYYAEVDVALLAALEGQGPSGEPPPAEPDDS